MISLRVTQKEALQQLCQIPHKTCQKAIQKHWQLVNENSVKGQSVLWLFCWAKTGLGSEAALLEARRVFNEILTHDCFNERTTFFEWFELKVAHEYARIGKYSTKPLEQELESLLCTT